MTRITTASILMMAGLLLSAQASQAASVTIEVTGQPLRTVRHAIETAARKVCSEAIRMDPMEYGPRETCETATIEAALRQLAHRPEQDTKLAERGAIASR